MMTTDEQPPQKRYRESNNPRAIAFLKRNEQMKSERAAWESLWQEIAEHCLPHQSGVTGYTSAPDVAKHGRLFDTSALDSTLLSAAGVMSWTTPANGEPWFDFEPPRSFRGMDEANQWTHACAEESRMHLANSNFYTQRHEDLLGHVAFGTSAIFVSLEGNKTNFKALRIGTYCIAENFLGQVDTLYREFELTARQAKQQFGTDKLGREVPLPEKIAECLKSNDESKKDQKFTFIHVVEPRPANERGDGVGLTPGFRKAWTDIYICKEDSCIVSEDGFDSFPYMVGRWMQSRDSVWGEGPGQAALPDARQLNFWRKMLDCAVEKTVFPPYAVPDTLEGELDMRAGCVTEIDSNIDPRHIFALPIAGDLKWGFDMIAMRKREIENKFHVEFFQMFRNIDPKITATLTRELASERFQSISPALTRLVWEKDTPMLMRCFDMWAAAGMLPEPPEAMRQPTGNGYMVPNPQVAYTSRLALAEKALRNVAFDRSVGTLLEISKLRPGVLHNLDWHTTVRGYMRNNGVASDWMASLEEVQQIEAQEAKMQQMQMAAAAAKDAGAAAGSFAKAASEPGVRELIGA